MRLRHAQEVRRAASTVSSRKGECGGKEMVGIRRAAPIWDGMGELAQVSSNAGIRSGTG